MDLRPRLALRKRSNGETRLGAWNKAQILGCLLPMVISTVYSLMLCVLSAVRTTIAELKIVPTPSTPPRLDFIYLIHRFRSQWSKPWSTWKRPDGISLRPLEVMTGITPFRALFQTFPNDSNTYEAITLWKARAERVTNIRWLQGRPEQVHRDVSWSVSLQHERSIATHNGATNIVTPAFEIRDFVLVRHSDDRGHKLRLKWFGLCRITKFYSPLVYDVSILKDSKTERVHFDRLIKSCGYFLLISAFFQNFEFLLNAE